MRWVMLVIVIGGCAAVPEEYEDGADKTETTREAILGGTAETRFDAVGALVTSWGSAFCTGTLFADRWVITAAHCLEDAPSGFQFMTGASTRAAGRRFWAVETYTLHPTYQSAGATDDVAIVELREAPPITPIPLVGTLTGRTGATLLAVGYGVTSWGGSGAGTKRSGSLVLERLQTRTFSFRFGGANTCSGDSGGPALLMDGAQPYVAGIHNVVYEPYCENGGRDMRVDYYRGFVDSIVGADTAPEPEPTPEPTPEPMPPPPPAGGTLLNESGSLAQGEQRSWTLAVPGAGSIVIDLTPTGDIDMYASGRGPATRSSWDCRPYYAAGRAERCAFTASGASSVYLMLDGYTAGTYSVQAVYTP
jgi:V8-like Glu-specific endopeptidase